MSVRKEGGSQGTTKSSDCGCRIDIHIESRGDVYINNCTTSGTSGPPKKDDDHVCPPVATGACVPASLGSKPKQSRRQKLDALLANNKVPSALGASFFHLTRRFLSGASPANTLEERTFAKLQKLPPDLQRVLACARDSFDALSGEERGRLFDTDLLPDIAQPIDVQQLTQALGKEIVQRVGDAVFADPDCAINEHPGQVRTPPHPGGEFPPAPVVVCQVNDLRTASFRPPLGLGEYTPAELQQQCQIVVENNQPKQICQIQTTNCQGHDLGGVCLKMQDVEPGQAIRLQGVNFSSVDTKVRITDVATFTIVRDVDAHVCGDEETQRTEIVNGQERLITDCRVKDRLTFKLPDDLPIGIYDMQVIVPNVANVPGWGPLLFSDGVRVLNVVPPTTARFQIASERLNCREETSPESLGSDEVGIRTIGMALFPDFTGGEPESPNGGKAIRFGDVDTGDTRAMEHVLFSHQQPIIGASLSIMGYEVDGEEAFEKQIDSFTDAYVEILKDELKLAAAGLAAIGGISKLSALGLKGAIVAAIAIAVVLAIDVFVALWAPADLLIEDSLGPTINDLVQLTSVNFPLPPVTEYKTPQGIKVKVVPLEKIPQQYRERREYRTNDSRYEILLRYNRLV